MTPASPSMRRRLLAFALLALAFLGLVAVGYLWMQSTALATLQAFDGPTVRDRSDAIGKWQPAAAGDEFDDGDGARTSAEGAARFRLGRSGSLTLKPKSQVRFRRRGEKSGRAVGLTVEVGEVEVRTEEGTLSVGSEFGELVLEPKSRVRLTRKGARLLVGVKVGSLRYGPDRRTLAAGQGLTVAVGGLVLDQGSEKAADVAEPTNAAGTAPAPPRPGHGVGYADLVVVAGQTFAVHDEAPPTAIGFRFDKACPKGGRLEIGAQWTEAVAQGNLLLAVGRHEYVVRCLDRPNTIAVRGELRISRDSGTRQLPSFTPNAQVTVDGRTYTVLYQARLPSVTVSWPTAPEASSYLLTVDGRTTKTTKPAHTFSSGALGAGTHIASFSADTSPPRASRPTTIVIKLDAQAPTGRVSEPRSGFAAGGAVPIAGQALPGWSVSVDGAPLQKDGSGRFSAKVPVKGTLAIAFSHPAQGMHYYLRRPQGARRR